MSGELEERLAKELIRRHPDRAAVALERLVPREVARLVKKVPAREVAALFVRLSPRMGSDVLNVIDDASAASILDALPFGTASRIARQLGKDRADTLLERLSPRSARGIRSLIRFPENSAGALMDPHAVALRETFSVREALDLVRRSPESTSNYLAVVDLDQRLSGTVTLHTLVCAKPREQICDLMTRRPPFLQASADRSAILSHPGWRVAGALPVVDTDGAHVGAIDYFALRQLEALVRGSATSDASASDALGELFAAGAGGLFEALTATRGNEDAGD